MEDWQTDLLTSEKKIKIADHMLQVTYPLSNDQKMLVTIANTIGHSITDAVRALVKKQINQKKVHQCNDEDEAYIAIFKKKYAKQHNVPFEVLRTIESLDDIKTAHEHSPMEFARKEGYVICSENYTSMITLSAVTLSSLLSDAKKSLKFIHKELAI